MVPAACRPSSDVPARGRGTELLLLRPGTPTDLQRSLTLFAGTALAHVLAPPRAHESGDDEDASDGDANDDDANDDDANAEEWAARFAGAHSVPHVPVRELGRMRNGESDAAMAERAWPALERALGRGPRVLAVLSYDVLRVSVACALGLEFARSIALRVDPGRVVLLRDDPIGWVLRRSNVLFPEESSGTALPSGHPEAAP